MDLLSRDGLVKKETNKHMLQTRLVGSYFVETSSNVFCLYIMIDIIKSVAFGLVSVLSSETSTP